MAAPSLAVVGGITNLSEFSNSASPYYGMDWSYNYATRGGTSVAVGYFTLLTANHYTMAVGDTFTINGDTFSIKSMASLDADPGLSSHPDMRILHMENLTNPYRALPGFYDLYTYSDPFWPAGKQSFVMVGTGNTGSTASTTYYTDDDKTRALRWGTNRYDSLIRRFESGSDGTPYSTRCIEMSYSMTSSVTPHESGLGIGDSGGGVFVKDGDTWKLAGMGLYRSANGGGYSEFHAASIPYYADRLYDILQYDVLPGDLNLDGNVDSYDYVTLKANFGMTGGATWYDGDFSGDGNVGSADLDALEANYDYTSDPHPIMTPPAPGAGGQSSGGELLPEPTTLLLLGFGAIGLTVRRRRRRPDR